MAYNDPIGEWIRPKVPDTFEEEKPPGFPRTPLIRTRSCPEISEALICFEAHRKTSHEGLLLWDDLLRQLKSEGVTRKPSASRQINTATVIDRLAKLHVKPRPKALERQKSRSAADVRKILTQMDSGVSKKTS